MATFATDASKTATLTATVFPLQCLACGAGWVATYTGPETKPSVVASNPAGCGVLGCKALGKMIRRDKAG